MNKVNSFINQFVAIIKGDDAEASAQKVYRKADSCFKQKMANLEGLTVDKEIALQEAKEEAELAFLNYGKPVSEFNSASYYDKLIQCQNAITVAEANMESHQKEIEFCKSLIEKLG